jgi:diaminohydroxyphosphoribosylaminopyrimidine deaminase/5-amino-6-(5-phosphoribosylamino)uracil reductase
MNFTAADARHMARALVLARRGLYTTDPNPRVGCVIVRNDQVVGEGWHARAGEPHAEIHALRAAGDRARGADVYLTLEPCRHHGKTPPCVDALIRAEVGRVIAAMRDPNPQVDGGGFAELERAGIGWAVGLLEEQARALNPGFIHRMARGRPFVRVKLAASLDGRTALASGESRWITGEASRADVQHLRARSSAILTGVGTVLADDPALTVRAIDIGRQPVRVVLDSKLRMSPEAQMLRLPGKTWVLTAAAKPQARHALEQAGAEVIPLPDGAGRIDLDGALRLLAQRKVNEVLVEAGPILCGSLLEACLVDEIVLYLAPHLLGDRARGLFHLPAIARMSDRIALDVADIRVVGHDWRITATPVYPT